MALAHPAAVPKHRRPLPLRVGTRASPLALWQTRDFLDRVTRFCPVLRDAKAFEEHPINTSGDRIQDRKLADIGGKGLFAKEIHEALLDGRVDFAVHSLKDLETEMPPGIVLACTLKREDARDCLLPGPSLPPCDPADPFAALPQGAVVGTSSVRRQSQLLHRRPDLQPTAVHTDLQRQRRRFQGQRHPAAIQQRQGVAGIGVQRHGAVQRRFQGASGQRLDEVEGGFFKDDSSCLDFGNQGCRL